MTAPTSSVDGWRPRWYAHGYNRAAFYRLAAAIAWLPRGPRLRLAAGVGRLAASRMPSERAAVRATMEVVTGTTGRALDALTVEVFGEFAMFFSDLVSAHRESPARLLARVGTATGIEHVRACDGAVVSLTAHIGNWDMAGRLLASESARRTHVVVAEEESLALERWVRRNGDGVRFVTRSHPTVSLTLLAALRRGEAVAMQGDRALGNRGDVRIPFFGRPAPFPSGPFRLAAAARVPVIPAFCTLGPDRRYTVTVRAPLVIRPGSEEDALRVWVADLEGLVRERPTQWFNFFDIWNPWTGSSTISGSS